MDDLWDGGTEDKDAEGQEIPDFDWHEDKNQENIAKHGISFREAEEAFEAPEIIKPAYNKGEKRWAFVGATRAGRSVLVVYTMRGEKARIISARRHP